ncbi:MAG: TlpA disulfide reductase family protein [Vicinamibacteria bacterium]
MIAAALLVAGLSILGQPVPEWPAKAPQSWVQGGPLTLAELRGKVVLIRFFMDADCPLCRGTAPALNEFHREFSSRGLVVVGMYTPKPRPRPVRPELVREYVEAYGFQFPVVVDDDWSALRRLWLDRVPDAHYTSASLLIDRNGILRHVHEGGLYAKDAAGPGARRGYEEMRSAIVKLLSEP